PLALHSFPTRRSSDLGQEVAVVQYSDVYRPVAPTDEDPIATSESWGSPCAGLEGPVPSTSTSTPMWHPTTTTTTTPTTAAPRPRSEEHTSELQSPDHL